MLGNQTSYGGNLLTCNAASARALQEPSRNNFKSTSVHTTKAKDCASHCQPKTDCVHTTLISPRGRLFCDLKDRVQTKRPFSAPKKQTTKCDDAMCVITFLGLVFVHKAASVYVHFPKNKATMFKGHRQRENDASHFPGEKSHHSGTSMPTQKISARIHN